jgi:NTE family protein
MFNLFQTKQRYGLALGSGGFKGFVHIGVIKALEELDVEITHIGGSSIGSIVGGMYALWGNIDRVEEMLLSYDKEKLLDMFKSDIGLLQGVFKGDSFIEELDKLIGNASFSDCLIPFVAVSVDINTGEKIYHSSGALKDAIRASCSLPFVFKPYELNGRNLVDGGLAENVPVEATKSIGAREVLGVNVQGFPINNDEKLNLKSLSEKVYRVAIYHLSMKDSALADKALQFNLEDMGSMDMIDNPEDLIEMGYKETMKIFN